MLVTEFENLIGQSISPADYKLVELVYLFHPAIPEVGGKNVIAELYKAGGMILIEDMVPRAGKIKELTNHIDVVKSEYSLRLEKLQSELAELRGEK